MVYGWLIPGPTVNPSNDRKRRRLVSRLTRFMRAKSMGAMLVVLASFAGGCSRADNDSRATPASSSTTPAPRQRPETSDPIAALSASAQRLATELGLAVPAMSGSPNARTVPKDVPEPRRLLEPSRPVDLGPLAWKTFQGEGFSVSLPGEPKETKYPSDDDRGAFHEWRLDLTNGLASFVVGSSEHSDEEIKDPDAFLEEHIEAPRRGLSDVLTKRSLVLPGGHHGRVLVFRRHPGNQKAALRIYSRLFLVGHRLYALVLSTLDEGGVSEDVAKKFMESFKL